MSTLFNNLYNLLSFCNKMIIMSPVMKEICLRDSFSLVTYRIMVILLPDEEVSVHQ